MGLLLNDLFSEALATKLDEADAVAFGKLLQLVNVTRDFHGDWAEGRCFWPGLAYRPGQPAPAPDLLRPAFERIHRLFTGYRDRAADYLARLRTAGTQRPDIVFFCAFPLAVAVETMALARAGDDWLAGPAPLKLPRARVEALMAELLTPAGA